jgi:hypothetical protein
MQDCKRLSRLPGSLCLLRGASQTKPIVANLGWINAVVASIQCRNKLGKDAPYEIFGWHFIPSLVVLDNLAQISISTILHV